MNQAVQTIEDLFELLDQFKDYPHGVLRMPTVIPGTAFFPGGLGLWNPQPVETAHRPPADGIIVVGHNFDSEVGFEWSSAHRAENMKGATWRNLLAFLRSVDILPEQCFFTNAYIGLIAGNIATGTFPGAHDHAFVQWCQDFLLKQFQLMQPRLVLSLGMHVPQFLAQLSPELNTAWAHVRQIKMVDEQETGLLYPITIEGVKKPIAAVALTHPAYRQLNARYRRYQGLEGDAAEQALVRDALAKTGSGL